MRLTGEECWARLGGADHGILGTVNAGGGLDPVPVCFAVVAAYIATPIDVVKPKDTSDLGRVKNLAGDPTATLLCEHWDADDWSALWWVRARLARLTWPPGEEGAESRLRADAEKALRTKYRQYAGDSFADLLLFEVTATTGWSAAG